jgi:hypothetical protein
MHVEDCLELDIRSLYRWSHADGVMRICSWSRRGKEIASVYWRLAREGLDLTYMSIDKRTGKEVFQMDRIDTTWTPWGFDGERIWFKCPCGRRVLKLYLGPGKGALFRCRHCHNLTNASRHDPIAAKRNRMRAIRRKLVGSADLSQPFPDRPKRMHQSTYERLYEQYKEIETDMTIAAFGQFELTRPLVSILKQLNPYNKT